jgi:hypothetical protein
MSTRTYYSGPDAVVTSELFVWLTQPPRIFAIRELRNVGIARCGADFGRPHTMHAAGGSVIAAAAWPTPDTTILIAIGLLVVGLPIAVAAYRRLRPRLWELHGTYRHATVILYASTDTRVFNQVARALRRAMEDADPHTGWDARAAA